jgi:cation:H+ antiporter
LIRYYKPLNTQTFLSNLEREMIGTVLIIILLVASLFILIKGADYLIDGSSDVARWLKVSPILVGLTVVAFGTSLPELVVSLFSIIGNSPDISIGNIIGSNIANLALVIGICVIFTTLYVKSRTLYYELPILLASTSLLVLLGFTNFSVSKLEATFSRLDGLILIIGFALFLYYVYKSMKRDQNKSVKKEFKQFKHDNSWQKNTALILGGSIALVIGGRLFMFSASNLAEILGISEAFIGLVIAALGTSLPELATSGIAAWKKQGDLAIGNIVGSNIFNILFVLGTVSLIKPLKTTFELIKVDSIFMLIVTGIFFVFAITHKKVTRAEGITLLVVYLAYLVFLFVRL